jgi:class 3 adenylate cyclase/YHS domain-containing protein
VRVERGFAFIDLSGFTALTAQDGDERAVALLTSFRSIVRDVCSRRGVRIAKWLGDGAMLVSVDSTALLSTLLEIEHSMKATKSVLNVRCGASFGEVILHEGDDYIGHPVNVAARLCDLAPGGEVYATREVADARPAWSLASEPFSLEVKGFLEPLEVVSLGFRSLTGRALACPVCGIPLVPSVAFSSMTDAVGALILFCSESCRETYKRRPRRTAEEQGSLRSPLMGF